MKSKRPDSAPADRLPPHNGEAEAAAVGCVLFDLASAGQCLDTCGERGVSSEWFYDLRWQLVFGCMVAMHKEGVGVDVVTLMDRLRQMPNGKNGTALDQVGGLSALSSLSGLVPSAANLSYYLDILEEQWLLRSVIRTGTALVADAYSITEGEKTPAKDLLARAEREVLRLQEEGAPGGERHIKLSLIEVIHDLEDYHRGGPQMRGIGTGLEYVDKVLCGLGGENGNYIVVSGRPGTGKTSFATQVAIYAACDYTWWDPVMKDGKVVTKTEPDGQGGWADRVQFNERKGVPVAIFSMEMAEKALVKRILFQRADADIQRWRTGFAVAADFPPMTMAAGRLSKSKIFIDDTARMTIDTLKSRARRMARQLGIKLFVIDYIQLMRAGGKRFREDRVQELAEISAEIQALGKELNVPFIVLAQMNRDYEKDPKRKPRLSDLKDCGSIEQDADLVGFLYEPKMKEAEEEQYLTIMCKLYPSRKSGKPDWSKAPRRVDFYLAKNRYGLSDTGCQLLFQKSSTRFLDYNVWLKNAGYKQAALGESQYGDGEEEEPGPAGGNIPLDV